MCGNLVSGRFAVSFDCGLWMLTLLLRLGLGFLDLVIAGVVLCWLVVRLRSMILRAACIMTWLLRVLLR